MAWIALAAPPSLAQNELGDGRGLEINQAISAPPSTSRRARFDRDLRFANAIVTGNAPGGLSFRGDLGYTAGAEFRSSLGSNDLFAFRRDSLNSGLAGYGIRGTTALQYQFSLTTGSRSPSGLLGSPIVLRSGTGMTGSMLRDPVLTTPGARRVPGTDAARLDPQLTDALALNGSMLGTLRSTSSYLANEAHQPVLLGTMTNTAGQRQGIIASPLDGLHQTLLDTPTTPDEPRPGRVQTSYDLLLSTLKDMAASPAEPTPPARADWEIQLDELRTRLSEPAEDDGQAAPSDDEFDEDADLLLRLRDRVGTLPSFLAGTVDETEAYGLHMKSGEALMGLGRFFDAEERFTRALAVRPGDIAAQVARVHAQLGAGMFRSGALNLRTLLTEHPEIVGQRYSPGLLPDAQRTRALQAQLADNQAKDTLPMASALLGAYLGYQTGDREAIRAGLDAMRASDEPSDRTLGALLERVWLGPEPESATPQAEQDQPEPGAADQTPPATEDSDG